MPYWPRKTLRVSIPELTVSILRVGLLQNLIVIASPMASIAKWSSVAFVSPLTRGCSADYRDERSQEAPRKFYGLK